MESNLMNGYREAYALACESIKEKDPRSISRQSGCLFDESSGNLTVVFLGAAYHVNPGTGEVVQADSEEAVSTTTKVLILHYLLHAKKTIPSGSMISFREVKGGGANYYPSFYKRAILPLQKTFETMPALLVECGEKLGGRKDSIGDASVTVPVFPLIQVTYAVWQGDEEIPGSATILFDGNVASYLPCEDIVLSASFGTYALMRICRDRKTKE